jgi:hypothetical protein
VGVALLMLLDLGRVTVGAFVVRPATQLDQLPSGRLMATQITFVGQDFPLRDCSRHRPIGSTPQAKALIARGTCGRATLWAIESEERSRRRASPYPSLLLRLWLPQYFCFRGPEPLSGTLP